MLAVGFVPVWLLLVRRPEDLGLLPDRAAAPAARGGPRQRYRAGHDVEASIFAASGGPHPGLLAAARLYRPRLPGAGRGQPAPGGQSDRARASRPTMAASIVSLFSLMSGVASAACGLMPRALADPLSDGARRRLPDDRLRWR